MGLSPFNNSLTQLHFIEPRAQACANACVWSRRWCGAYRCRSTPHHHFFIYCHVSRSFCTSDPYPTDITPATCVCGLYIIVRVKKIKTACLTFFFLVPAHFCFYCAEILWSDIARFSSFILMYLKEMLYFCILVLSSFFKKMVIFRGLIMSGKTRVHYYIWKRTDFHITAFLGLSNYSFALRRASLLLPAHYYSLVSHFHVIL